MDLSVEEAPRPATPQAVRLQTPPPSPKPSWSILNQDSPMFKEIIPPPPEESSVFRGTVQEHTKSAILQFQETMQFKGLLYRNLFMNIGDKQSVMNFLEKIKNQFSLTPEVEAMYSLFICLQAEEKKSSSKEELNYIFGMSLLRFVNVIIDNHAEKEIHKTMRRMAVKLGIPEKVVDLRNAISHKDLPSTELLKPAIKNCLMYLKKTMFKDFK